MVPALAPPQDLVELVGSTDLDDFYRVGSELVVDVIEFVALRPWDQVLEVGCGSGRVAIPLLSLIDDPGSYTGFDVVPAAVEWCQDNLTPVNPRFRFLHCDVASETYNADGDVDAEDFVFPFGDASFDVVILTSVFTHLLSDGAQCYVDEIARVLRPGGRVFSTWFMLDDFSRSSIVEGSSEIPFQPGREPWWTMDPELPEWAIAYDAKFITDLFADTELAVDAVIHGTWCGRPEGRSFQDILVGHRRASFGRADPQGESVHERYDVAPLFDDPRSVHSREVTMVGNHKRVLELGCSFGHTSAELQRRGCQVTGVELDPAAAKRAADFCERVVVADLEAVDLRSELGDARFDVVLCGDVLEHLKDPVAILRQAIDLLVPEGYVVASIPNVAHGSIRLALLQGRFEYRELGLLDRTHIHLFTKTSIESTFREAGLAICELHEIPVGIFETEIPVHRDDFAPEVVAAVEADPQALTYHFLVKAVVDDGSGIVDELRRRIEALERESAEVRAALADETARADEVTRWADHLVGQRDRSRAELRSLRRRFPIRVYRGLRRRAGLDT